MQFNSYLLGTSSNQAVMTRLISVSTNSTESGLGLVTSSTASESSLSYSLGWDNTGFKQFSAYGTAKAGFWSFGRAPSFMDVVCYTGDGTDMTLSHNLGVVPELLIVKRRSVTQGWFTYSAGTITPNNYYLQLDSTAAQANAGSSVWNNTATTFLAGTGLGISANTQTYVAYLFATCAGVSKVGSYTGTAAAQTINCGFTAGSRFVMIKRTDSTGDWYVWDSARGIIAGNDPYLLLNSTAAEVTGTDYVDTANSGFEISSTAPAAINANGGSFIFLAIA
jgi:hypothetical protein